MEDWIFSEGTVSFLSFHGSNFTSDVLEGYAEQDLLNSRIKPSAFISYIEPLKVLQISGDPASIAVTTIKETPCIVRSIGAPRLPPKILSEALFSKLDKLTLEESIIFEPIKTAIEATLWH